MLSVLTEILSHVSEEKEDKKAEGFQISPFYGSFSKDIMAVKGLRDGERKRSYAEYIFVKK